MIFFYDSYCPLCTAEVDQLTRYDTSCSIRFIDIHDTEALSAYPQIDPVLANERLHLIDDEGKLATGLDATYLVWSKVGKHRWLKLLRLPVIRIFADVVYRLFAKHRYTISFILTGKRRCSACSIGSKHKD